MNEGKQKAPAQFVRMPDGSVKVVSVAEEIKPLKTENNELKKHRNFKFSTLNTHFTHLKKLKIADFKQKRFYYSAGIILILVIGLTTITSIPHKNTDTTTKVLGQTRVELNFLPLLAPGKKLVIDPESKRNTGSYADQIGGINIRVSEQALPADFKPGTDVKMADFAKTNYYNEQTTAGNTKIYVGVSIKGVQSIVFTKNDVLVFIKSESKLELKAIADYVAGLKQ